MEKDSRFRELMELLVKIESSKRHCEINVKFDGARFRWEVTFGGLRASEFNLAKMLPPGGETEQPG